MHAQVVGDTTASKAAGISERTLHRWRSRMASDPALTAAVQEKTALVHRELDDELVDTLRKVVRKISSLVEDAPIEALRDVNGSAKIIGDLLTTRTGMGIDERSKPEKQTEGENSGGQPDAHRSGQETPPARSGAVIPIRGVRNSAAE
jgi:phage terminase small subunit